MRLWSKDEDLSRAFFGHMSSVFLFGFHLLLWICGIKKFRTKTPRRGRGGFIFEIPRWWEPGDREGRKVLRVLFLDLLPKTTGGSEKNNFHREHEQRSQIPFPCWRPFVSFAHEEGSIPTSRTSCGCFWTNNRHENVK